MFQKLFKEIEAGDEPNSQSQPKPVPFFLRGLRLSKPSCWLPWTTSIPQMIFLTHNEPQRAAWMVCMCVSTVGDMWLVYILYRSNLLAHCLWGISGMGTFPTLYLQELRQSEGKTLLYLLLKSRQVSFLLHIKTIIIKIFFPPFYPWERKTSTLRRAQRSGAASLVDVATTWLSVCTKSCNMSSVTVRMVPISESFLHLLKEKNSNLCISSECKNINTAPTNVSFGLFHNMSRNAKIN